MQIIYLKHFILIPFKGLENQCLCLAWFAPQNWPNIQNMEVHLVALELVWGVYIQILLKQQKLCQGYAKNQISQKITPDLKALNAQYNLHNSWCIGRRLRAATRHRNSYCYKILSCLLGKCCHLP